MVHIVAKSSETSTIHDDAVQHTLPINRRKNAGHIHERLLVGEFLD